MDSGPKGGKNPGIPDFCHPPRPPHTLAWAHNVGVDTVFLLIALALTVIVGTALSEKL